MRYFVFFALVLITQLAGNFWLVQPVAAQSSVDKVESSEVADRTALGLAGEVFLQGPVVQNGGDSYSVAIYYQGDQLTIVYPELSCGGTLSLSLVEGETWNFSETLTFGKPRCGSGGFVTLTPEPGGGWTYGWAQRDGGTVSVIGVLADQKAAEKAAAAAIEAAGVEVINRIAGLTYAEGPWVAGIGQTGVVIDLMPDGIAREAGLMAGDLILGWDEGPQHFNRISNEIHRLTLGYDLNLWVQRPDGSRVSVVLDHERLEELMPPPVPRAAAQPAPSPQPQVPPRSADREPSMLDLAEAYEREWRDGVRAEFVDDTVPSLQSNKTALGKALEPLAERVLGFHRFSETSRGLNPYDITRCDVTRETPTVRVNCFLQSRAKPDHPRALLPQIVIWPSERRYEVVEARENRRGLSIAQECLGEVYVQAPTIFGVMERFRTPVDTCEKIIYVRSTRPGAVLTIEYIARYGDYTQHYYVE